jgi:hypothetical protein
MAEPLEPSQVSEGHSLLLVLGPGTTGFSLLPSHHALARPEPAVINFKSRGLPIITWGISPPNSV